MPRGTLAWESRGRWVPAFPWEPQGPNGPERCKDWPHSGGSSSASSQDQDCSGVQSPPDFQDSNSENSELMKNVTVMTTYHSIIIMHDYVAVLCKKNGLGKTSPVFQVHPVGGRQWAQCPVNLSAHRSLGQEVFLPHRTPFDSVGCL